jgi:membrane-associated phospholipid phosphatase
MNNIIYDINKISDLLSDKGPIILLFFTIIILIIYNVKITFIFLVGYFLNIIINKLLKKYINDIRPLKETKKNRMPSGHSQLIFYIIGFMFFVSYFKKIYIPYLNYILFIYLLFLINTIYDCIKYKYHTIDQLLIGGILGILLGYLIIFLM